MRLIDVDYLLTAIDQVVVHLRETSDDCILANKAVDLIQYTRDFISQVDTIEAEPVKHGRWVGTADGYADGELVYDMWECSKCGYDADGADEKPSWNYCPNCGAKMDGGST